jgi:pyrroloquinoline quinone biosynthesis protein B
MAIHVRLLGTAAGGGLPQWNCSCFNCRAARNGEIPTRTQSSVAISADGESWFLVNASPDLRRQIESHHTLTPTTGSPRNSPISGILLTNADLDHVLGLLLLREGEFLPVIASKSVKDTLSHCMGFDAIMDSFCGIRWKEAPSDWAPLQLRDEAPSGLEMRAVYLPGNPPLYAKNIHSAGGHSIAFLIRDAIGATLLVAPDVAAMTPELELAMQISDAVLFDGTFWSEDELHSVNGRRRYASEMGHVPIRDASLEVLKHLGATRKIFIHINNTNPILPKDSVERSIVEDAGITIGEDAMEFTL